MAKIFTLVMVVVGIMAILNIAGLSVTGDFIKNWVNNPGGDIESTTPWYWVVTFAILGVGALTGIVVGIFGKQVNVIPFSALIASSVLFLFIVDVVNITKMATEEYIKVIIWAIVAPLSFAYAIALWDWVRSIGSD